MAGRPLNYALGKEDSACPLYKRNECHGNEPASLKKKSLKIIDHLLYVIWNKFLLSAMPSHSSSSSFVTLFCCSYHLLRAFV